MWDTSRITRNDRIFYACTMFGRIRNSFIMIEMLGHLYGWLELIAAWCHVEFWNIVNIFDRMVMTHCTCTRICWNFRRAWTPLNTQNYQVQCLPKCHKVRKLNATIAKKILQISDLFFTFVFFKFHSIFHFTTFLPNASFLWPSLFSPPPNPSLLWRGGEFGRTFLHLYLIYLIVFF